MTWMPFVSSTTLIFKFTKGNQFFLAENNILPRQKAQSHINCKKGFTKLY